MPEDEILALNNFVKNQQIKRRCPKITIGMYEIWCPVEWFNKNGTMKRKIIKQFEKINKNYCNKGE